MSVVKIYIKFVEWLGGAMLTDTKRIIRLIGKLRRDLKRLEKELREQPGEAVAAWQTWQPLDRWKPLKDSCVGHLNIWERTAEQDAELKSMLHLKIDPGDVVIKEDKRFVDGEGVGSDQAPAAEGGAGNGQNEPEISYEERNAAYLKGRLERAKVIRYELAELSRRWTEALTLAKNNNADYWGDAAVQTAIVENCAACFRPEMDRLKWEHVELLRELEALGWKQGEDGTIYEGGGVVPWPAEKSREEILGELARVAKSWPEALSKQEILYREKARCLEDGGYFSYTREHFMWVAEGYRRGLWLWVEIEKEYLGEMDRLKRELEYINDLIRLRVAGKLREEGGDLAWRRVAEVLESSDFESWLEW
jgi:hypothetical protein